MQPEAEAGAGGKGQMKVFISQPMTGRTKEEILMERQAITNIVKRTYGEDTEIIIPSEIDGMKVTTIGNAAFKGCSSLTSITIPEGVTNIGIYAFSECSALESIKIPKSLTSINAPFSSFSPAKYNL